MKSLLLQQYLNERHKPLASCPAHAAVLNDLCREQPAFCAKALTDTATHASQKAQLLAGLVCAAQAKPEFDVRAWSEGKAGFGVVDQMTPASAIGTPWKTADIWLRKTIKAPATADFQTVALRVRHDEDVDVYLNGRLIFSEPGFNTCMTAFDVTKQWKTAARSGNNTLAVHVHQTVGGQYIDLRLVLDSKEKLALPVQRMDAVTMRQLRNSRWASEKAWKWYKNIVPSRGFNYVPRTAVNATEMWQVPVRLHRPHRLPEAMSKQHRLPNGRNTSPWHL